MLPGQRGGSVALTLRDAHHIVHWLRGGITCLENPILCAATIHTLLHEGRAFVIGHDVHPITEQRRDEADPPLTSTRQPVTAGMLQQ